MTSLPATADVVVIGGGAIGASIAFHLAEAGVPRVLLVERDELASGSSSRGAGGVRAHFSDALNVELGRRSLELFEDFPRRPGADIELVRPGYLFPLTARHDVEEFERSVALQIRLGVPTVMLEPEEAKRRCPLIEVGDVLAASLDPHAGYAHPPKAVRGYAAAAQRLGACVVTGCEVTGIRTGGGEVRGVTTSQGTVRTGVVVCAAGAWSRAIGQMAGVELPVTPYRRQVLYTEQLAGLPCPLPFTIDFATFFYFRSYRGGALMGLRERSQPPSFSTEPDPAFVGPLRAAARRRAPALAGAPIAGGWAGLYEQTPDHNALIGEAPEVPRFLYATGFSGHGFLQAPAVGEMVRDLYMGRSPFIDVSAFSAERFAGAAGTGEYNVV